MTIKQNQTALDLLHQAQTIDECHQACSSYLHETGFSDYTLIRLDLYNKETPPTTLFTSSFFKTPAFFTTHSYNGYKSQLKISQRQTTPFIELYDRRKHCKLLQMTEFFNLYPIQSYNKIKSVSLYFPYHIRYQFTGFFMLSGKPGNQQELYNNIANGNLFANYLADKITSLKRTGLHPPMKLSEKESLCLYVLADGGSHNDVGQALGIATKTVTYYIKKLIRKLGANNRYHAIALAISQSLVTPKN